MAKLKRAKKLGHLTSPQFLTIFNATIIKAILNQQYFYAEVWCFSSDHSNSRLSSIYTDKGRYSITHADRERLLLR